MNYSILITIVLVALLSACTPNSNQESDTPKEMPQEKVKYNSKGEVQRYIRFDYNENGNKTRGSQYHVDGDLLWYWEFEYVDGRIVKAAIYNGTDEVSVQAGIANKPSGEYFEYEYEDEDELNTKIVQYTANGTVMSYSEKEYNNLSVTKESWYTADGTMTYYCEYDYDADNTLIKGNMFDYAGALTYYETYEYDGKKLIKITSYNKSGENIGYDIIR